MSNLTIEYTFESIESLADYIEEKAKEARARASYAAEIGSKNSRTAIGARGEAFAFESAANIVRQSKIGRIA